jgi:tetratricopeptide (TPR) repeat protein
VKTVPSIEDCSIKDCTMTRALIAWFALTLSCAAAEPGADLFREAEDLSRRRQKAEALAKAEEGVEALARAHASGEKIGRTGMAGLQLAARLAREDFLDYDKALLFGRKMLDYAESDYWRVPAHLELAVTYRAMGDFKKAQQQYDAIAAADERYRPQMLLPRAKMVYFDKGDRARGRQMLEEALNNDAVNWRERYNTVIDCARRAMDNGRRDEALEWYAMLEKLPNENADERTRYLARAWYEMGKIEESRGRTAQAKAHYRKAMNLEGGEMRYRVRARDALEGIEYFE